MNNKKYIKIFFILFSFVFFLGLNSEAKNETDIQALELSAQKVWEAKVAGDWSKVYKSTATNFRSKVSLAEFLKNANLEILSYRIEDIALVEDGDSLIGNVDVEYTAHSQGYKFDFKRTEKWVFEGNQWLWNLPVSKNPMTSE